MFVRIVVTLILSVVVTVVLVAGAAAMDGMCHCLKSMHTLFPYGTFVEMHYSDTWGFPLSLIQFPVYALVLVLVKGWRWRLGVAGLILVLHIAAASFALHDYCQSRRNCFLQNMPTSASNLFVRASLRGRPFHSCRGNAKKTGAHGGTPLNQSEPT